MGDLRKYVPMAIPSTPATPSADGNSPSRIGDVMSISAGERANSGVMSDTSDSLWERAMSSVATTLAPLAKTMSPIVGGDAVVGTPSATTSGSRTVSAKNRDAHAVTNSSVTVTECF